VVRVPLSRNPLRAAADPTKEVCCDAQVEGARGNSLILIRFLNIARRVLLGCAASK